MRILGFSLMIAATVIFYVAFFVLAPYFQSLVNVGADYKGFYDLMIIVVIAYFGGIGIPLALFLIGIFLIVVNEN